jgi:hypothetical protein
MKPRFWKNILIGSGIFIGLCVVVLAIHIYVVTRPRPLDPHALIMARIDFKQDIDQNDANAITSWLYGQKGVDHVLCNPQNHLVVFTFFPGKTSGDLIVQNFKSSLHYKAERFMPTEAEMQSGCPVGSTSGLYNYIKNHF